MNENGKRFQIVGAVSPARVWACPRAGQNMIVIGVAADLMEHYIRLHNSLDGLMEECNRDGGFFLADLEVLVQ